MWAGQDLRSRRNALHIAAASDASPDLLGGHQQKSNAALTIVIQGMLD